MVYCFRLLLGCWLAVMASCLARLMADFFRVSLFAVNCACLLLVSVLL